MPQLRLRSVTMENGYSARMGLVFPSASKVVVVDATGHTVTLPAVKDDVYLPRRGAGYAPASRLAATSPAPGPDPSVVALASGSLLRVTIVSTPGRTPGSAPGSTSGSTSAGVSGGGAGRVVLEVFDAGWRPVGPGTSCPLTAPLPGDGKDDAAYVMVSPTGGAAAFGPAVVDTSTGRGSCLADLSGKPAVTRAVGDNGEVWATAAGLAEHVPPGQNSGAAAPAARQDVPIAVLPGGYHVIHGRTGMRFVPMPR